MHRYSTTIAAGVLVLASAAGSAAAQPTGAGYVQRWHPGDRRAASWDYCGELIGIFDKYTASRSESSDGGRNHARIAAEIVCHKGDCDYCSIRMADLLKGKHHAPPAPPAELGLAP